MIKTKRKESESMQQRQETYKCVQIVLKERLLSVGSGNLKSLEDLLNEWYAKGYELDKISTAETTSKGITGGDRILATCVLKRIDHKK